MAERQIVFRWIRQNLGAILSGLTLATLSVTALVADELTVNEVLAGDASLGISGTEVAISATDGGSFTLDSTGATAQCSSEETLSLACGDIAADVAGAFTLEMGVPGHLSTLTCNNGGCAFVSAQTDTTYGVTVGTGSDVSSLEVVDTGITAGATGAASNVYLSWSDALLSSVFRLDKDPDLTSTGSILVTGDYVTLSTAGGAGDVNLQSDNDIAIQGGGLVALSGPSMSLTTSAGGDIALTSGDDLNVVVPAGGVLNMDFGNPLTTGVNVYAGQDVFSVYADNEGSGDDVILKADDSLELTSDYAIRLNQNDSGGMISLYQSNSAVLLDSNGVTIETYTAGNDITVTARDALALKNGAGGPTTTIGAYNGTLYRLAPVMDFDYPNAAPGTTGETVMASQLIPASTMTATGRGVGFEAWGTASANTNAKIVRIELGSAENTSGTSLAACTFDAAVTTSWRMTGRVFRTGSNTQAAIVRCESADGSEDAVLTGTAALTDTAVMYAIVTMTNGTSSGDASVTAVRWFWL